jgi:hypothetical protein
MTTTIRSASLRDLIALAWYRLGYRPRESLVALGLHGPRQRVGAVARVDLPEAGAHRIAMRSLAETMRRTGHRQVLVLVVSDRLGDPGFSGSDRVASSPSRLLEDLAEELSAAGLSVLDLVAIGPTAFRSYLCEDAECRSAAGIPLSEIDSSEVAAAMVVAGATVVADEDHLVADVEPVSPGGFDEEEETKEPGSIGAAGEFGPTERSAALARWLRLVSSGCPDPREWSRTTRALSDPALRDAIMISLVPGVGTDPEAILQRYGPGATRDLFARRPDVELAERGRRLLAAVARRAPEHSRAPALSVLAWLSWWCGHGTRARMLADMALRDVPGNRLAGLVQVLVERHIPPPWVGTLSDIEVERAGPAG